MILIECIVMAHRYCNAIWDVESLPIPEEYRLTFGQYKTLDLIGSGCDQMAQIVAADKRPEKISERIWAADRSVTSSRASDLLKRELIIQGKREKDRRSHLLSITPKGKKALEYAKAVDAKTEGAVRRAMGEQTSGALNALRSLAKANLNTQNFVRVE